MASRLSLRECCPSVSLAKEARDAAGAIELHAQFRLRRLASNHRLDKQPFPQVRVVLDFRSLGRFRQDLSKHIFGAIRNRADTINQSPMPPDSWGRLRSTATPESCSLRTARLHVWALPSRTDRSRRRGLPG